MGSLLEKIEATGLFDQALVSSDVGFSKPDRGVWECLQKFAPTGSIVIDDRLDNCKAAEEAGYTSIRGISRQAAGAGA